MKKRNLFAELTEGFDALSDAQKCDLTLIYHRSCWSSCRRTWWR